jgi:hypothetical protein
MFSNFCKRMSAVADALVCVAGLALVVGAVGLVAGLSGGLAAIPAAYAGIKLGIEISKHAVNSLAKAVSRDIDTYDARQAAKKQPDDYEAPSTPRMGGRR